MEAKDKKVLIITYYWPPSGGSGVQRWLKFVKYLPAFGWQPFVLTPEKPAFDIRDDSLLSDVPDEAEVFHFPIWEPYEMFFRLSTMFGARKSAKPTELVKGNDTGFFQRMATWVRANLMVPDPRVFWVKPSVSFLNSLIRDNAIRIVVTTGPPHSVHLIGLRLKKKNPSIRWIADFRDPWSEWGLLESLRVGRMAMKKHRRLERVVLRTADDLITITPFYKRRFEDLSGRSVHLITNGFDDADFKEVDRRRPESFIIRHVGIINERCDPRPFMDVVESIASVDKDFLAMARVEFVGEVHPVFRAWVEASPLKNRLALLAGSIPHKELLKTYGSSSLLLLVLHGYKDAGGYLPGKLFEYLATGIPVLGVGPTTGDAAALLQETSAGQMFEATDQDGIRQFLVTHFREWKDGVSASRKTAQAGKYSRKELTSALVRILES